MNHDITITSGVLLEAKCSCGEVLLEGMCISLEKLAQLKWDHLTRDIEWSALKNVPMHGSCDKADCKWCNPNQIWIDRGLL